jgi:hypothetical protein
MSRYWYYLIMAIVVELCVIAGTAAFVPRHPTGPQSIAPLLFGFAAFILARISVWRSDDND